MTRDDGWVSVPDAAARLGLATGYVADDRRNGRFPVVRRDDGGIWLRAEDVERLAAKREAERAAYVSYAGAAQIVGCSDTAIERAVRDGEIEHRPGERDRGLPSLRIDSVRAWGQRWRERQEAMEAERARRNADAEARRRFNSPPDDGDVRLDTKTAAIAVGVTVGGLRTMALEDRVPHARIGRRVWFGRDLLEHLMAARVAASRLLTCL